MSASRRRWLRTVVAVLAALTLPSELIATEDAGAAATQAGTGLDVTSLYKPTARFTEHEHALMFYGRLHRAGESENLESTTTSRSDSTGIGHRYFDQMATDVRGDGGLEVRYAVEDQPEVASYQYCSTPLECNDIHIRVRPDSGLMYLHSAHTRGNVYQWLAGFRTQPVEISASDTDSELKIYREVAVTPSPLASGCDDYPDDTPETFACLYLRELLPPEGTWHSDGVDSDALRDDLPDLAQDSDNYRLIFADEFSGTLPDADDDGCVDGLSTLSLDIWDRADACDNVDSRGEPCANVANGHLYVAHTVICETNLRTFSKFHFKYGYIELKYTVDLDSWTPHWQNYNFILSHHGNRLRHILHLYDVTIDDWEDFLRNAEVEIDLIEYIPASQRAIAHQYGNWDFTARNLNLPPTRTNKTIRFCKDNLDSLIVNPDLPCDRSGTMTVTMGVEWTPRGYLTRIKVDGIHDEMITWPKDKITVRTKSVSIVSGQPTVGSIATVTGNDRDQYFEQLDPLDPDTLVEKVAVSHLPLPVAIGTWGFLSDGRSRIRTKLRIDYIRVWQPENLYTDMEPVYQ